MRGRRSGQLRLSSSWLVGLLLLSCSAALALVEYTCDPVVQPVGGCDAECQRITGNTLLQLSTAFSKPQSKHPWHNQTAYTLCTRHCHPVPSYCGWPGVICCHTDLKDEPPEHTTDCRATGVEHDMCPGNSSAGAVWKLDLTMQGLEGRFDGVVVDALKVLTGYGLHAVDFSSNKLTGTIPQRLSELGENFTTLNLNFNRLTGTIPSSLKLLPNLKHVYLSFNRLEGTLQGLFCTRPNDPMEVLVVRSNFLTGTVDLRACVNILLLDITDNQLTGTIPIGIENSKVVSLRATNNKLSGSIPDDIWKLPMLTTIDIASNDLTGTISERCGTSNNLVNIFLGNNSLFGTIPENVAGNSQLLVLELHNNPGLYGSFPSMGALVGLRRLDIHNTSISGTIPLEWGQLPYLEFVDISATRMTCCQTQEEADDPQFPVLPNFLMLGTRYNQFDLNSDGARQLIDADEGKDQPNNILCYTVVRRPLPEASWNLLQLPITANVVEVQRWQVSPIYYWFEQCTCTKFYDKKQGSGYSYHGIDNWCDASHNALLNTSALPCLNMSIFSCEPISNGVLPPGIKAAIAVAAFLAFCAVMGLIAYLTLAKASKFKRYLTLSAVRLKGPPRHGRMTLVVTDIEGYSDIFRRSPEVMFKALVLHNSVLRAAKYYNGGFVLEQEGDSFTISFYDPFDAVVFCLQAQQALLAVQWPAGLEQGQQTGVPEMETPGSRKGSRLHMRLSPLLGFGPRLKRVNTNNSARSMTSNPDYSVQSFFHTSMNVFSSKSTLAEPSLFNGLRVRMGVVTGDVPAGTSIKNSALFQLAKVVGDFGNGGQIILDEATFAAVKDDAQALGAVDASGLNHSKLSSGRSSWSKLSRLLGIARRHIPAEEVVLLDMGAFCQASAEDEAELPYATSRTLDVKLQPDSHLKQASSSGGPWWQRLCQPCSPCCGADDGDVSGDMSDGSPQHSALPPAAQMSRPYLGPQPSTAYSKASTTISTRTASTGSPAAHGGSVSMQQQQQHRSAQNSLDAGPKQDPAGLAMLVSFSARATKQLVELRKTLTRSQSFQGTHASRRDWESVRLYQVLPPALASRAHVWHNTINLKPGWICWDNMYFEAPGSTSAPLTGGNIEGFGSAHSCNQLTAPTLAPNCASPASATRATSPPAPAAVQSSDSSMHSGAGSNVSDATASAVPVGAIMSSNSMFPASLQPLPPVTMVFMAVEGPEQLVRRRRPFTPVVNQLLSRVVRDSLRRLGGYLCRVQEGDMKFMVVFADPTTALEWCLLVQIAAMYLPWPQSAIMLLPSCREQVDSSGRVVFRGPRLKMGVCEGVPRSILPDHEGRADYHGQSINMAARFMDKGARGGQIACTRELAEHALAVWAARGGTGSVSLDGLQIVRDSIAEDDAPAAAADVWPSHNSNGTITPPLNSNHSLYDDPQAAAAADGAPATLDSAACGTPFASLPGQLGAASLGSIDSRANSCSPAGSGLIPAPASAGAGARSATPDSLQGSGLQPALGGSCPGIATGSSSVEPMEANAGAGVTAQHAATRDAACSWPGGSKSAAGASQLGRQASQHRLPRHPGQFGFLRPRRSSADGSTQAQLRASSRLHMSPSTGTLASAGSPGLPAGPPPVAPSPFVMSGVVCAPFKVEVHRLGMYGFKGGPPQQEMVQVMPTHLLGRAEFLAADGPPAASRKGQLLQRLDGRVGEPVAVPLPGLAQEYYERLPNRVSGITGLPHVCMSTTTVTAARQGAYSSAGGTQRNAAARAALYSTGPRGSRSVTLPVRGGLLSATPAASATGNGVSWAPAVGVAAGSGALLAGQRRSSDATTAERVDGSHAVAAPAEAAHTPLLSQEQYAAAAAAVAAAGKPDSAGQASAAAEQHAAQELELCSTSASSTSKAASKGAAAAGKLGGAPESCTVDVHGLGLRHDSFRSVGDEGVGDVVGDEEVGSSLADEPPAAGSRSKSVPFMFLQGLSGTSRS